VDVCPRRAEGGPPFVSAPIESSSFFREAVVSGVVASTFRQPFQDIVLVMDVPEHASEFERKGHDEVRVPSRSVFASVQRRFPAR